ncbi:MAG: ribosome small subunit-dependent GTPase A [Oscillospiraceae bacterium]
MIGGNGISAEYHDRGIITKAVGGVYYVDALSGCENGGRGVPDGRTFACAARGIFRQNGISPSAGDYVVVTRQENAEPLVSEILERRNFLVRPPLANLDGIVFVISCCDPAPNRFVLDKLIAIADSKGIEPMIAFTKPDLKSAEELAEVYRSIGITVCMVNNMTGEGAEHVRSFINGRITAFIGNSGVGKSSLMNALFPQLALETGVISKKLGRGKHTTRQAQLYRLSELDSSMTGYAADTPGFSTVDTERYCRIPAGELDNSFREFAEFAGECQFADCAHVKEKGCAVRAAVERGDIAKSRYESYLRMYEEASRINDWE